MVTRRSVYAVVLGSLLCATALADAQDTGSIRGVVYDADFNVPVGGATITILETGQRVTGGDGGNFVVPDVPPGTYTVVISRAGFTREVIPNVVVTSGQLTEVDTSLSPDFEQMDEFIVQDLEVSTETEQGLIDARFDTGGIVDGISSEFISKSGASDAAESLQFVAGATVQDGSFAVIRGLPDRFVSSQLNGVRLPTADAEKRAVQLDQFPSAVIDSIQISKTFTPDQQGDASGGAVNIILKGIPDQTFISFSQQFGYNEQVAERSDFLTYEGGGLNIFGDDDGKRDQPNFDIGEDFTGAAGVSRGESPLDFKTQFSAGVRHVFDTGVEVGGLFSFFYERDSSFYDNGINDQYWVETPGEGLVPRTSQGSPDPGEPQTGDFKTSLFDITEGTQTVQWGALATAGIKSENHRLDFSYLFTRIAEDTATLAEDTRGKEFFFPGYDRLDPDDLGNTVGRSAAPELRTETLEYRERVTETFILSGEHTLPWETAYLGDFFTFKAPVLDWTLSHSEASFYEPDKRSLGQQFNPVRVFPPGFGIPPQPSQWLPFQPAAVFTLGFFQRTWREINEESDQFSVNLTLPYEQWTDTEGYFKFGLFRDQVFRTFNQDSFSNFNDVQGSSFEGEFEDFWSQVFPFEDHPVTDGPPFVDVDYEGRQNIFAYYVMSDFPITEEVSLLGGVRFEGTDLQILNDPEQDATYFPPGSNAPVELDPAEPGQLGAADVDFARNDVLPAIGVVYRPSDELVFRWSFTETIARQTFRELTPIQQQEFLGGDIFIGNPALDVARLKNWDFRVDYRPNPTGFLSASVFYKEVSDSIENVQRSGSFTFTTPVNFPSGELLGLELEARQDLGEFWEPLQGLGLGANATFIDSSVRLPDDEIFQLSLVEVDVTERQMTNTPELLYNLYVTYDNAQYGTQASLFWTFRGDTLVAGGTRNTGNFIPSIFEEGFGTLNFTFAQKIGEHLKFTFKAKNLTNPTITEVFRSDFSGPDTVRSSFTRGVDFSIGLSAEFRF